MTNYQKILMRHACPIAFVLCITFNVCWFWASIDKEAERLTQRQEVKQSSNKWEKYRRWQKFGQKRKQFKMVDVNTLYEQVKKNWNSKTQVSPAPGSEDVYPFFIKYIKKP